MGGRLNLVLVDLKVFAPGFAHAHTSVWFRVDSVCAMTMTTVDDFQSTETTLFFVDCGNGMSCVSV